MKIHIRHIFGAILLCLPVFLMGKEPPAMPNPPRLVVDYTGTLGIGEIEALERKLVAYDDSTSTQIAIVIEQSTEGDDIFEYSRRLAETWGIGRGGKNNGVLIYIALGDRALRIQTGYGAEGFLPDALAKRIISNSIAPNFKQGKYFAGLDEATDMIMKLGSGEYLNEGGGKGGFPWEVLVFFVIFIIIVIIISRGSGGGLSRHGRYDSGGGWIMFGPGGFGGGGGGGSGWGGGGGGGGGFGGFGGGDFGGGGAGGDW